MRVNKITIYLIITCIIGLVSFKLVPGKSKIDVKINDSPQASIPRVEQIKSLTENLDPNTEIRKDVKDWIDNQPIGQEMKISLINVAIADQSALTIYPTDDNKKIEKVFNEIKSRNYCFLSLPENRLKYLRSIIELRRKIFNSKDRVTAYEIVNQKYNSPQIKIPDCSKYKEILKISFE
jgi:hypothetical protein